MVECRVSILGITIMIWGGIPITVPRTLWEYGLLDPKDPY